MGSCHSSLKGRQSRGGADSAAAAESPIPSTINSFSSASSFLYSKTSKPRWWKSNSTKTFGVGVCSEKVHEFEVPGRICSNGSSRIACLYTQQGKKGVNQDAMVVHEAFGSKRDTIFCGVFDGHGPFGHMVAKKVQDTLPLILCTQWTSKSNEDQSSVVKTNHSRSSNSENSVALDGDEDSYKSLEAEENEKFPKMFLPLKVSLLKSFKLMDKELKLHPKIDCFCSGSTAVTLIKQGQNLILGNVGDSRAVLATIDEDNSLIPVQLTVDLKPDLPAEAARIQQCKGRVFALQDEPEVARVWLPNNDSPGLAMARAFGDFCLKDFGLISVPDVYYRHLTARDQFVILATDGVWDVLSNKEAIEIVASAPSRETSARALVDCAVRAWRLKYPTSKNDDCAVVCLFLEYEPEIEENTATKPVEEDLAPPSEDTKDIEVDSNDHGTIGSSNEIVPVDDTTDEKVGGGGRNPSKRSLAECISNEEEEWSALEGVTRVNSLLSLPRFLSGDKRSGSWRKWL
ncbi:probable protein phosphatase 2C 6 [Cucurbita pepo subsp. pepo]|uniref:probable protein phosphatase 2C 6 n=1 Tax=Cucurbita pepo subsp. pepo TaxID=3664 RepID=UPI000C9D3378|nr:probable protein phosphatase 2C 6 [Cucurbita pepo subsp. pepo]